MKEIIKKLCAAVVKVLMELMKLSATKYKGSGSAHSQIMMLDLLSVDLKLDGLTTYLSWSCRIEAALVGKRLDEYLIGVKAELVSDFSDNVEDDE
jgi:hypothetical protein